jgi:hypothetical protein
MRSSHKCLKDVYEVFEGKKALNVISSDIESLWNVLTKIKRLKGDGQRMGTLVNHSGKKDSRTVKSITSF